MAGYSGTPLVRKLGIASGSSVLLDGAPGDFALDELPDLVVVQRRASAGPYDVILCFCPDRDRLIGGGRYCTPRRRARGRCGSPGPREGGAWARISTRTW